MSYKTPFMEYNLKYWKVGINYKDGNYYKNKLIGVVAKDAESAIYLVKEKAEVDIKILSVNHEGSVDILGL